MFGIKIEGNWMASGGALMRRGCFGALVCSANYEKNYGRYETFDEGIRITVVESKVNKKRRTSQYTPSPINMQNP